MDYIIPSNRKIINKKIKGEFPQIILSLNKLH